MNCIIVDKDEAAIAHLEGLIARSGMLDVVGTFTRSVDAIKTIQSQKIDLLFLEIEMPDMSGWSLLESIYGHPLVIVTTSSPDYALQAFERHVIDYLIKPIEFERFVKAVAFAQTVYDSRQVKNHLVESIFVKTNGKWIRLQVNDIKYIQAMGDYVRIFTTKGRYVVNRTMKSILNSLPAHRFARIHRSYIVNIERIVDVDEHSVVIDNDVLPVSEHYRPSFMEKLNLL